MLTIPCCKREIKVRKPNYVVRPNRTHNTKTLRTSLRGKAAARTADSISEASNYVIWPSVWLGQLREMVFFQRVLSKYLHSPGTDYYHSINYWSEEVCAVFVILSHTCRPVLMMAQTAQAAPAAQNWILIISEQHRYQGVSYKSDIIVISVTNIT